MDSAGPSSGFETFRQALCVLVVEVAWSEPERAESGRRSLPDFVSAAPRASRSWRAAT